MKKIYFKFSMSRKYVFYKVATWLSLLAGMLFNYVIMIDRFENFEIYSVF